MSIDVISSVWKHSTQSGTPLLMLLAIADHANEFGEAFPGIEHLAQKCRMKRRNAQELIKELEASGELKVARQQGADTPHGKTNMYTIITPGAQVRGGVQSSTPHPDRGARQYTPGVQSSTPHADRGAAQHTPGVQSNVAGGAVQRRMGCTPLHPEPSLTVLTTTTTTRAWNDDQAGGGGGGETIKYDVENVETDPLETQANEADVENVKRDLVDALSALGIRPEMAAKTVAAGTVKTDYDVILCKRFIQASTANVPAAVLWSQYLSIGRVPPPPVSDTSTVTADQLAAARRMREEMERRAVIPGDVVGLGGLAAALSGPVLRSIAPSIALRPPLPFPGKARP